MKQRMIAFGSLLLSLLLPGFTELATSSASAAEPVTRNIPSIRFQLDKPGRTSLAVYGADGGVQLRSLLVGEWLLAGPHELRWDGLDRDGRAVEPGKFQWKLVTSAGIEADYLGAMGANPKAGGWTKWVGNHNGPSTIAVGPEGIVVGASIAEGPPSIHMFEPDFSTSRWLSPEEGWSAFGARAVAMTDKFVVRLRQDARLTVHDVKTGKEIKSFDALWAGDQRPDANGGQGFDIDALGEQCVVSHFDHDAVRWYELPEGKVVREVAIAKPKRVACVAFRSAKDRERTFAERKATIGDGSILVLAERGVVLIDSSDSQTVVIDAKQLVQPVAMAWDASNQTVLVANGEPDQRILRFSANGKLLKTYGVLGGRQPGPYFADRFAEVADIAADQGRFYVVEGGAQGGLRRIALVGEDGAILDERFGGAQFFACAAAVPGRPHEVYFSSSPNTIGLYDFDPETGKSRLTHLFRVPEEVLGRWSLSDAQQLPALSAGRSQRSGLSGFQRAIHPPASARDRRADPGRHCKLSTQRRLASGRDPRTDRESGGVSSARCELPEHRCLHLVRRQWQRRT